MSDFLLNRVNLFKISHNSSISFKDVMPRQRSRNNRLSKNRCGFKRVYNIDVKCLPADEVNTINQILKDRVDYIGPVGDVFSVRGIPPNDPTPGSILTGAGSYFGEYMTISISPLEYTFEDVQCVTAWVLSGVDETVLSDWDFHVVYSDGTSTVNGAAAASTISISGSEVSFGTTTYSNVAIYGFEPCGSYINAIYSNVRNGGSNPSPSRFPTVKYPGFDEQDCVSTSFTAKLLDSDEAMYSVKFSLEEIK